MAGTGRLSFVGLPALGLRVDDGSERTVVGRGRRDACLDGGGARVGLFLAAWLTVSMTDDDWRETSESARDLGGGGATSACPATVGEAFEWTWSNELAHETA